MSLEQGRRIFIPEHESVKEQDIKREIEVFRKDHIKTFGKESNWRTHYLNNFFLHFPHEDQQVMAYRNLITFCHKDAWEKPFKDFMTQVPAEGDKGYSELFLNQTPREFYLIVDEAAEEHNINAKKIYDTHRTSQEKMNELIMPVYISLRKKGYTHYKDLTA